jgi:tetratricopeptide (TPR) repeat protein
MELKEEKELAKIAEVFTEAMQIFSKKDFEKAQDAFESIIEHYKDSEYYSVLEIQARSEVYKNICHAQLHPLEIELKTPADFLNEAVFNLNAGKPEKARECLDKMEKKDADMAYVNYLYSLVYLKKADVSKTLEYLKKAVAKDRFFKIIAHNEPDFDRLFDNEEFSAIIEK